MEWGSMIGVGFFFNVHYDALYFHSGSLEVTIFKVHIWEGGLDGDHKEC